MRKHLLHSLSILAACTATLPLVAQETQESGGNEPPSARVMFGAFGAGTMNIHRGLFSTYDGILECGTFEDTETIGWQAGNVLDIPLAASFGLSTRLYYHKANGDFNVPNAQDWKVSCGPADFADFVKAIRDVEATLGRAVKEIQPCEREALNWALKSLVAARDLPVGTVINADLLRAKRPGDGIPPGRKDELIGKRLARAVAADANVRFEDLEP